VKAHVLATTLNKVGWHAAHLGDARAAAGQPAAACDAWQQALTILRRSP
jgi:hypothetical protein